MRKFRQISAFISSKLCCILSKDELNLVITVLNWIKNVLFSFKAVCELCKSPVNAGLNKFNAELNQNFTDFYNKSSSTYCQSDQHKLSIRWNFHLKKYYKINETFVMTCFALTFDAFTCAFVFSFVYSASMFTICCNQLSFMDGLMKQASNFFLIISLPFLYTSQFYDYFIQHEV